MESLVLLKMLITAMNMIPLRIRHASMVVCHRNIALVCREGNLAAVFMTPVAVALIVPISMTPVAVASTVSLKMVVTRDPRRWTDASRRVLHQLNLFGQQLVCNDTKVMSRKPLTAIAERSEHALM